VEDAVHDGPQLGAQLLRQAQQLADHLDRQRVAELLAQVDDFAVPAGLLDRVEQRLGDLLDTWLECGGAAGGEGLGDQPAQPLVLGAVRGEHALHRDPGEQRPLRGHLAVDPACPVQSRVLGDPRVGEQPSEQLGVGDRPRLDAVGQFDGRDGATALPASGSP
jgi:hypothetical protein